MIPLPTTIHWTYLGQFPVQVPPEVWHELIQAEIATLALLALILAFAIVGPILYFAERRERRRELIRLEEVSNMTKLISQLGSVTETLLRQERHLGDQSEVLKAHHTTTTKLLEAVYLISQHNQKVVESLFRTESTLNRKSNDAPGIQQATIAAIQGHFDLGFQRYNGSLLEIAQKVEMLKQDFSQGREVDRRDITERFQRILDLLQTASSSERDSNDPGTP